MKAEQKKVHEEKNVCNQQTIKNEDESQEEKYDKNTKIKLES